VGLLSDPDQQCGFACFYTIMKLSDIETSMRGNFVWDRNPDNMKILQTNAEVESSVDTALIVFCGLGEMYGFDAKDTAAYLSLTETEYYRLLRLYRKKMTEAQQRIARKQWDTEINDLVQKVWIKSKLLQNYLRLHWQQPYQPLSDLPNL
jgi:hypothetical protein